MPAVRPRDGLYSPYDPTGTKLIAQNKKAFHDYHIEETLEAGIVLTGTEVKSLRDGRANLRDSYAVIGEGELWLIGVHISPYEQGNIFNHDPLRKRKLLVHKAQIQRLLGKVQVAGFTLVPTKLYFKDGRVKVEIGLAKGKTLYDKRDTLAKKEAERDMERALRGRDRSSVASWCSGGSPRCPGSSQERSRPRSVRPLWYTCQ